MRVHTCCTLFRGCYLSKCSSAANHRKVILLSEPRLDLIFRYISKLDHSRISCIHMSTVSVSSILRLVHHRKAYARNMKLDCHTMSALSSIVIHIIVIMC